MGENEKKGGDARIKKITARGARQHKGKQQLIYRDYITEKGVKQWF